MFSWNSNTGEKEVAGPPTSERPDWLENNDPESQSGKDWDTSEKAVTTSPTDVSPTSTSGSTKGNQSRDSSSSSAAASSSWCKRLCIMGLSALLSGAFIYSAIVQKNDKDKFEWYIFYSISAAIPAFFLCQYMLCFPAKIIYALSFGMTVWSIVMIILISPKIKDTPKGGDDKTLREEYIYELAGVSLGLFSAVYHTMASRCFISATPAKGE